MATVLLKTPFVLRGALRSRASLFAFQSSFLDVASHCHSVSTLTKEEERRKTIDTSLGRFLSKTYMTTGAGIVGFLATAQVAAMTGVPFTSPMLTIGAGFVGALGSSIVLARSTPHYFENEGEVIAINSTMRQAAFATLCGSFGLLSSPLIGYMTYTNPSIVGAALLCSTATMAGASAYALSTKRNITVFGSALTGGLFGLIGISLTGMGAAWLGYPALASSLNSLTAYGSVVIFTGLTAYDTQVAMAMHQLRQPDHLGAASQFIMNFANLFQAFMRIFSNNE